MYELRNKLVCLPKAVKVTDIKKMLAYYDICQISIKISIPNVLWQIPLVWISLSSFGSKCTHSFGKLDYFTATNFFLSVLLNVLAYPTK